MFIRSSVTLGLALTFGLSDLASAEPVHTVRQLQGYQCMSLATLWNGQGPMPPPVPAYSGPGPSAEKVGIAGGSLIAHEPLAPKDGRVQVLFANGHLLWVDQNQVVPWHAASNPNATCSPALLSNGRYGFAIKH